MSNSNLNNVRDFNNFVVGEYASPSTVCAEFFKNDTLVSATIAAIEAQAVTQEYLGKKHSSTTVIAAIQTQVEYAKQSKSSFGPFIAWVSEQSGINSRNKVLQGTKVLETLLTTARRGKVAAFVIPAKG